MAEKEKIAMHINIAGERIKLSVDFDQQDDVRAAERSVADLFEKWRVRFAKKSDRELLAMIAYQYASYYLSLCKQYDEAVLRLEELDRQLTELLEGTAESDDDGLTIFDPDAPEA